MAELPKGFSIVEEEETLPEGFSVVEEPAAESTAELPKGFSIVDDDPTLGEIGTGLVADVALAEGLKYAGAAGGAALGSAVPVLGTAVGGALGYAGGAITGGISGSIAAQKIEGRDDISWGRVVGDTLLNFIPGSKLAKGGSVGSRVVRAGLKQGAIGAGVAPAAQTVESIIEEGKIPTKEELGKMAGMGGALGFGLGGASVGLEKVLGKVGGKTTGEVDEMVATGDLTFKDFKLLSQATDPKTIKQSPKHKIESVFDEMGEVDFEADDALRKIAKDRDLGITSDREASTLVRGEDGEIAGGAFISNDGDNYTFDVVVSKDAEGTGVGSSLLDDIIEMPYELVDMNPDATMQVDVVSAKMKKMLEARGFKVKEPLGKDRWLMEPKDYNKIGKQVKVKESPTMDGMMRRELEETAQRKSAEIAAAELINAREIAAKGKGRLGKVFASLVPSKVVGRKSQQAAIDYQRSVNEADELGSRIARNIEKRIGGDAATNDLVNRIIDGEPFPLSKDQYDKLGSAVADIQKYQEMRLESQKKMVALLDEGAYRNLDENGRRILQDAIQDSIGGKSYNRREYKLFLDSKYEPDPKLETAAFNELAAKMGPDKAKAHMDKLQNASAATRSEDPRSFMGAPVDSVLRRKHNPGDAERAWLGEVTEAPERIRGTLSGMGKSVARAEADSRIARSLVEDGIGSTEHSKGLVELRLRGTGAEGTGVYVNPEVQVALNNIYLPSTDKGTENIVINGLQDLYRSSVAGSKASKVLLNTIAYPVQLYGNTASLIGMGVNPFNLKNATRGADIALAEFGGIEALRKSPEGRKALLDEIQEMSRYGIKNANILDSDLRSTLDNGIFSKAVGKVTDPLGKAYSVPDTMGRYIGWKSSQKTLRKLFPNIEDSLTKKAKAAGKSVDPADISRQADELIKREAANMINDTYQNYDKLSNVVRTLSRWGVMPQFASFTAEFARNQYNQGIMLGKMLRGTYKGIEDMGQANTTAMRVEGAKRAASLAAVYGTTYAAIEGVKAAGGLNQDDQDAIRDLSYADYDKNKELMVNYDKKTRKGWTANPSYIIPHSIGLSALKAGMRGDDEASVVGMLSEELIGDGSFIMQEAFRALSNKDKYGKEITNEINELRAASDKLKYFIAESFRPGVSREFKKFAKAKRGKGDLTLKDVGQRQLGLRRNAFDMNKAVGFAVRGSNDPAKQQASSYYSLIKHKEPTSQEANVAYEQAERINQDSFNALVKNRDSMKQLGFSESEIIKAMKDGGVSSKRILSVLDGSYSALPRVKLPSTSERYEELTGNIAQKRRQIMEIRKTDRALAAKLMQNLKREQKSQRSGLTSKEDLLRNMDVGERASRIMAHPNPNGYMRELQRKGIATKAVVDLVRLKQRAQ